MVEIALVLPVLLLLLLGIIEFGLILNDQLLLRQSAEEGARAAAVLGKPVGDVTSVTVEAAKPTVLQPGMVQVEYFDPSSKVWLPAGDIADGSGNDVPRGAMIRVSIVGYRHRLVTGSFFSFLPGCQDGTLAMTASAVRGRE